MEYEINPETLVVLPLEDRKAFVMEPDAEYTVDSSVMEVIDHSCKYFGSSYSGRNSGTFNLLGIQIKTPIIIEETNDIIFFPTRSPRSKDCFWISYNNIASFSKTDDIKTTKVEFKNGKTLLVPISYLSFSNQYLRAGRLKAVLISRKYQK